MGLAVAPAGLPVLIGFGLAPRPAGQVAAGVRSLVAVVGAVNLATVCSGLVPRAETPAQLTAAASID